MARRRYEIISTAFDKRGRVLATATNDYKRSHPLFKHFSVLAGESPDKHYRHAEFNACLEAKGKDIHIILVQRFDAEGKPATLESAIAARKNAEILVYGYNRP